MENKDVLTALSALVHETRLAIFRLLVETGPEGLPVGKIGERLREQGDAGGNFKTPHSPGFNGKITTR